MLLHLAPPAGVTECAGPSVQSGPGAGALFWRLLCFGGPQDRGGIPEWVAQGAEDALGLGLFAEYLPWAYPHRSWGRGGDCVVLCHR